MPKQYTIYKGFIVTRNPKERTVSIYKHRSDNVAMRTVEEDSLDSEIDTIEQEEAEGAV